MSNQVYSSPHQKYYERGLNFYTSVPTPQVVGAASSAKIDWIATATIQLPGLLSIDGAGNITVLQEGVYSLACTLGVQPATNAIDPYCRLALLANGAGYNTQLIQNENRNPNTGSGGGISPQIPLFWAGYLAAGTVFSFELTNLDTVNSLATIPGDTDFVVSKLA